MQYALRLIFELTAFCCVYLALRRFSLGMNPAYRLALPAGMAIIASAYMHLNWPKMAACKHVTVTGLCATAAALPLTVEIAAYLQRVSSGDYFSWKRDWPLACIAVFGQVAFAMCISATIFYLIRLVRAHRRCR